MENATGIVFARLESAGVLTQPLHSINRVYVENAGGTGDAAPPIADLADRMRAEVPAAQRLFRSGSECFFEGEPADALLIDPQYITQVWRWRDVLGGNRWLLQTFCYPLMGRRVWGDLYELQGRTVRRLTAPLGEGALESFEATDELQVSKELKRLQIFRVHWGIFAVVVRAKNWTVLIDQLSGRSMGARIPLVDGALLAELRFTNDGRHLVQLNSDGRFFVHRVADGKRVLVGAHVDDEIVLANDDGLYDSTYEGAQAVQVRFPGMRGLHRYHQFEAALRRPGLAAAVLAGTAVPAPSAVPSPPLADLTLDAAAKSGRRGGTVIAAAERELSAVRLYVDGRLVTQLPAKGTRAEVMVDLPDPGGGRWISAVAVDARGLLSQPSAVQLPGKPAPRGTLRAVVVGVDAYEDRALPRLAYAKSDAQRFARALGASRGRTVQQLQTTSLLDAEVTPARVLAAVRAAAQATTPDDTLVIFYAGHGLDGRAGGQPDAGLVLTTPKTRMADLKSTALPWAALADALSEARGTIVVVLDACHAGIAGSDAFATNDDAVSALITRAGAPMVVLAGSKGRQLSHETPRAGGGLFTEAIAAVISEARASHDRDRSGLIDLGELYGAVKARVFEATKGQQTPWLARNALVGEMALF